MPAVAWVTLVATALIIAAAALGLIRVIMHLRHVTGTLDAVIGGVRSIADSTRPVPTRLTSVNANMKPVRDWCETV